MYDVDLYRRVRLACHHEGLSHREAALRFGIDRGTAAKMLMHSEPPGYQRKTPARCPKLDPVKPFIDAILRSDMPGVSYAGASDEHGKLPLDGQARPLKLGEKLMLIPGLCDPSINLPRLVCRHHQRPRRSPLADRRPRRIALKPSIS